MLIKIALSGAAGRMGKSIIKAADAIKEFTIIAKLVKCNFNNNRDKLLNILENADVFIDFSIPAACMQYLRLCKQLKIPMVIGTTGFTLAEYEEIASVAKDIPILLSPNMSFGANMCQYLLGCLAKQWVQDQRAKTTINIKEVHHKHKLDAPSGTALKMAEVIKKNLLNEVPLEFSSKRIGNVKGRHQVTFANQFEDITIKHNVKNRSVFANGALIAAKWLIEHKKPNKLYNFLDIMNHQKILATEILV